MNEKYNEAAGETRFDLQELLKEAEAQGKGAQAGDIVKQSDIADMFKRKKKERDGDE